MKKGTILFGVILGIFLLVGCGENKFEETNVPTETAAPNLIQEDPTDELYDWRIPLWTPWRGASNFIVEGQSLPQVELTEEETGILYTSDMKYERLEVPEDKWDISPASGWKIDVDALNVVGKLESGEIVLVSGGTAPVIICLYDATAEQYTEIFRCYLRDDVISADGALPGLDAFELSYAGEEDWNRPQFEYLWKEHTNQVDRKTYGMIMHDGVAREGCLTMVYKGCPALTYELKYLIYDGKELFIENIPSGERIFIPLEQIPQ